MTNELITTNLLGYAPDNSICEQHVANTGSLRLPPTLHALSKIKNQSCNEWHKLLMFCLLRIK